jgi:hypothetical protein
MCADLVAGSWRQNQSVLFQKEHALGSPLVQDSYNDRSSLAICRKEDSAQTKTPLALAANQGPAASTAAFSERLMPRLWLPAIVCQKDWHSTEYQGIRSCRRGVAQAFAQGVIHWIDGIGFSFL